MVCYFINQENQFQSFSPYLIAFSLPFSHIWRLWKLTLAHPHLSSPCLLWHDFLVGFIINYAVLDQVINNVIDIEIFHNFRATVSQIIFVSKIHCWLKLSPTFLKYLHQFLSTLYFYLLHITKWFILSIFFFLTRSTMLRRTDKMYKWDFFSSHFWWKFCKQNQNISHQGSNPKSLNNVSK